MGCQCRAHPLPRVPRYARMGCASGGNTWARRASFKQNQSPAHFGVEVSGPQSTTSKALLEIHPKQS